MPAHAASFSWSVPTHEGFRALERARHYAKLLAEHAHDGAQQQVGDERQKAECCGRWHRNPAHRVPKVDLKSWLLIDRIDLKCAPLVNENGVLRPNQAVYRSSLGGNGGEAFPEISCPGEEVGIGIFTRSGDSLDAFALVCDEFNLP